jgi:uncharacterized membrane protein YcaP (DUF421 family)
MRVAYPSGVRGERDTPLVLFHMGITVGEKALRAVLIYVFLLFALRVLGKREISQQNTLDLLVILLVANAVQNGIIGNDNSVTGAIVGALVLFGLHRFFSTLAYWNPIADQVLEGAPTYLVKDGEVARRALRHEQISRPQLLSMAQRQGIDSLAEINDAVLETDGSIRFTRKGETYDAVAQPPTPARMRSPRKPRAA